MVTVYIPNNDLSYGSIEDKKLTLAAVLHPQDNKATAIFKFHGITFN